MRTMKRATLLALSLIASSAFAQDQFLFNDIEAADELQDISSLLSNAEVDAGALNAARSRTSLIESEASACAQENSATRARPIRALERNSARAGQC
jgi:hypothetical protein